jgi:fumarate reductase subunit C
MTAHAQRSGAYRQPVSRFWWVTRRSYVLFVLRDEQPLRAWFVVFLLR